MKILEILLPVTMQDRSIAPQHARKIDILQHRMDGYVDKICDPNTSTKGKEFLRAKLRNDYDELKDTIRSVNEEAEQAPAVPTQYEVYDSHTKQVVRGRGPYNSARAARLAVDKLDNAYGGYRYRARPITTLKEAVHTLPLSHADFDLVKVLMSKPIPAAVATIYIHDIINDDSLNEELDILSDTQPNRDIRPLIAEWFNRVMPDQMYRFTDDNATTGQKLGTLSPIHGYDSHMYQGTNDPITGDAYGSR